MLDLTPATMTLARLVKGIADDHLGAPTPCPGYPVGGLLGHVHGLSIAFRDAARKLDGPTTNTAPDPTAVTLPPEWRVEIPERLRELAEAWRLPEAWSGMTQAGGVELPGAVIGAVAANELVLHGWDLAKATGQPFDVDEALLRASYELCAETPDDPAARAGLFGPVVPVPADAPLLDRTLGQAGRNPRWESPAGRPGQPLAASRHL